MEQGLDLFNQRVAASDKGISGGALDGMPCYDISKERSRRGNKAREQVYQLSGGTKSGERT